MRSDPNHASQLHSINADLLTGHVNEDLQRIFGRPVGNVAQCGQHFGQEHIVASVIRVGSHVGREMPIDATCRHYICVQMKLINNSTHLNSSVIIGLISVSD